jgi:iron complex transport system substrate-binding protein
MKRCFLFVIIILLSAPLVFAVDKYPERIVSGLPSITETLFALDLGDKIVGVTTNCDYPIAAKKKEKIGGFFLNLEKVAALKPDLVILQEGIQLREIQRFTSFGLPVFTLPEPRKIDDVLDGIIKIGEVTGQKRKAGRVVGNLRYRLSLIQPQKRGLDLILQRPRVLVIVGYQPLVAAGGGTLIDDLVQKVGLQNVAGGSRTPYPQYSFEQLLKDDPEYIIIPAGLVKEEEIKNSPRWQSLVAVRNNKILIIDPAILARSGPRIVEALEIIAKFINEKEI